MSQNYTYISEKINICYYGNVSPAIIMTFAVKSIRNRPLIMGVLNITEDSFSDGGEFFSEKRATKRAKELIEEGADIIDLGGQSTGPNSQEISPEEELKRILPILRFIKKTSKIPVSIDTYKSQVAEKALQEGADIINDVTAMRFDSKMAKIIAKYKCSVILMYSKDKTPQAQIQEKHYKNIFATLEKFFTERLKYATKNGISQQKIILDPGMGHFISKIPKYSYEILTNLSKLKKFGLPILVGVSRKSFLGGKMEYRDERTQPANAIAYLNGASILRVHNVQKTIEFFENFN